MKSLEKILAHLSDVIQAHGSIEGGPDIKKLTVRLMKWDQRIQADTEAGKPVDTGREKLRLFLLLIETVVTTADELTDLIAHKLLAEYFSHQEIITYLENHEGSFTSKFKLTYHPTKQYVQHVDLPVSTIDPRRQSIFSIPGLSHQVFSNIGSSDLMQMRELNPSCNRSATEVIFGRSDEESQACQIKLMRIWLSCESSWEGFKSRHLPSKDLLRYFSLCVKKQLRSMSAKNRKQLLMYRAFLARINEVPLESDQSLAETLIESGKTCQSERAFSALCAQLGRVNILMSPVTRGHAIEMLTARASDKESEMRGIAVRLLGEIAFYLEEIPVAIIDAIVNKMPGSGWAVHDAVVSAMHELLPRLSDEQIQALVTKTTSVIKAERIPGSFLKVLGSISSRLTPEKIQVLISELSDQLSPENDFRLNENIEKCLLQLSKRLDKAIPQAAAPALVADLLANEEHQLWGESQQALTEIMSKVSYQQWVVATQELVIGYSLIKSTVPPSAYIAVFKCYDLKVIPGRMIGTLVEIMQSSDDESQSDVMESVAGISFLSLPELLMHAFIERLYSLEELRCGQEARFAMFKELQSLVQDLSAVSIEMLYQKIQGVLSAPAADYSNGMNEEYFATCCIRISSIKLVGAMASLLTEAQRIESITTLTSMAESGSADEYDITALIEALVALYREAESLPDILIDRLIGDASIRAVAPIFLEKLSDKLTVAQVNRVLTELHTKLVSRQSTVADKVDACQLLVPLAARMTCVQFKAVEAGLIKLLDDDNSELVNTAKRCLAVIYIKTKDCGDQSLRLVLAGLHGLGPQDSEMVFDYLYCRLPSLTDCQLGMISEAADGDLGANPDFMIFQLTVNEVHSGLFGSLPPASADQFGAGK